MKRANWFTLIELILVIIIIWILMTIWMSQLSSVNSDRYYAEGCVNSLYSPISEWVYWASASRILTWEAAAGSKAPEWYIINVNQGSWWYEFFYLNERDLNVENDSDQECYLTECQYTWLGQTFMNQINNCNITKQHWLKMVSNFSKVKMRRSLQSYWNDKNWFNIYSWDSLLATWEIKLQYCVLSWGVADTKCEDFWRYLFDARTSLVRKQFCKVYTGEDLTECDDRHS